MNRVFSTRELAALCGVNESTIKRWADAGRLECVKTPGGHRKFRAHDVYNFLNQHGFDTSALGAATVNSTAEGLSPLPGEMNRAIAAHDPAPLTEAFMTHAREGGHRVIRQIILQLLSAGWSVIDICEELIAPALHAVGKRWADGNMTVMEEHLVSATTLHALSLLGDQMPRAASNGLRALCCGGESDQHTIGARMAALVLESAGWSVALSLSTISISEVSGYLRQARPDILCISLISLPVDQAFSRNYETLHEAARATGTRIAIGGRGITRRNEFEADLCGQNLRELAAWVEQVEARGIDMPSRTTSSHARAN